jgi:sugar transferase EpsL
MSTPKRGVDIVGALAGLVVLLPGFALVSLVASLVMGRPVLFRQVRAGRDGAPFVLYKFRTMLPPVTPRSDLLDDADRLTRFGRCLRSTSLDELPELFNVLKGDMSLVGPRPLLMEYLDLYTSEQSRRHSVRPGITGLAQISGRNEISWERRLELDVWYVDHHDLCLDVRILVKTFLRVIGGGGVSAPGHATSPFFTGSLVNAADRPGHKASSRRQPGAAGG